MREAVFESENIIYVKISESLIEDYLTMVNDIKHVARFIGKRRTPYSLEEELEFVRGKIKERGPIYSMLERGTEEFIGNIEFMDIEDGCGVLGIALTFGKQDKHYGTEAIHRMLQYGFSDLGLERVILRVYKENARAMHVYEKCGFRKYDETEDEFLMEINKEGFVV